MTPRAYIELVAEGVAVALFFALAVTVLAIIKTHG
jgi:hypothetical protein